MSSVTRRLLLLGASSAALARAANAAPASRESRSASREGRICLGLNGLTYYAGFYSFLNALKQGAAIRVVAEGKNYDSSVPPGKPNSAWDGYLDSDGELMRPLPTGVTHLTRVFFAGSAESNPEGFNRVGQQWVLKWDGKARDVSISGASSSTRRGNRIVWTWGSNTTNMWVTFSGMDPNDPPSNIRLCEARHEARLETSDVFNPDWLAKVREGSGVIRFMDWQNTNFNRSTLRFSDIPDAKYYCYGGETRTPFIKGGMPLALLSKLANQVQSHPWVCIPTCLGTKKFSAIETISSTNPAVVRSPGHTWKDGDQVIPYGTNWSQIERKTYTVARSDQRAGTFVLSGVDSTGFGALTSTYASLTSPFDLDSVAKELRPFAAHFCDNVASGLVTFFEFGNELWNWIFNAPHWLAAQARSKFDRDDSNRMAGYLSAHCMKVIRDVYGVNSRARWRGVLATQTTNPGVTNGMVAGVQQYLKDFAPALTLRDLFDDLAVTGYFGSHFTEKQKSKVLDWMDTSERRWRTGLEPTKYSYFNRTVNEDCADGRHTGMTFAVDKLPAFWRAQKAIADTNGLELIQYEGGNHNDPQFFGKLTAAEQIRFLEFYKKCNHTPEDAENYAAMFMSFITLGGQYPSKFVEMRPVGRSGAWGGLRYLEDKNPVWDAVVAFNGRS